MKTTRYVARLALLPLSLLSAGLCTTAFAQATTDIGAVKITGTGDALGNGQMIDEDSAKERGTVTRAVIEKQRPTSNPFQLLELQPGVNSSSYDATGLFGGNLRVRGFNSDEMGFTINGAPVNDSGNFAVYPQEYTDSENLCEIFITQGSVDADAPHVGASGGNVGLVTCSPNDNFGGKLSLSLGQLKFKKEFARIDTGLFGPSKSTKAFISMSHAEVNKFKGPGAANRDHVDLGVDSKLSADTSVSASLLFNHAVNNNFLTLTKAEYLANPNLDFTTVIPQHLSSGNENTVANFGTNGSGATPRVKLAYYGYSLNPFDNALFTSRIQTRVNSQLTLSAEPYYWYGYGTGGTEQNTLTESTSGINGGIADINGNGKLGDVVGVYRGSVTETHRPGVTFKADYQLESQKILGGLWVEQAHHKQTQPATTMNNNGVVADIWLQNDLVIYNNGATYEGRNYLTVSTGYSAFVTDTITLGKLDVVPAVRYTGIKRDFTNHASSGSGLGADYTASRTYEKFLPSIGLRFKADDAWQVFADVAQNMRAPSNFVLSGWVTGGTFVNGVLTNYTLTPNNAIQAETSTNAEVGVRYSGSAFKASATAFDVQFKNRIASGYNPTTNTYTDFNVGDSRVNGVELQAGSVPISGFSAYGSLTYTSSKILNNFPATATTTLPTSGANFPDTPNLLYGLSVQYGSGPVLAELSAKYTGKRYTTLVNDEYLDPYTVFDLNLGYRFSPTAMFKNPTLRLNVSNLFNKSYLIANSGSGSSITTSIAAPSSQGGGFPTYYVGAPRMVSLTLSTDF